MTKLPSEGIVSRRVRGFHPNVFFLGVVSFLTDVSSEMIFTLVPLFLSNVLGAATTIIGLVGGVSESADALFRIFSGWLSDRIGKRKLLAVAGYSISTVAKPFMYLASTWGVVLGVRFSDRVGKGIRTSPRDALLADSAPPGERGKSFGLHRAMDTSGAVVGLAIAALVIYLVQGGGLELSLGTYQWLVLIGIVPAVLAVVILLKFVKEREREPLPGAPRPGFNLFKLAAGFDTRFKVFLAVMALFTLGNSSDFFVILRAQNLGSSVFHIVLMLVILNAAYAAISLPAGRLSDRLGRRRVIALGWGVYATVYLGFAVASELWQVWLLFAAYGIYYGIVEGVARAFVADLVPEEKRGTAYGLYHGVVGLTLLPASLIAGWLWQSYSPAMPFFFGAGLAGAAVIGMMTLIKE
ncbi:MAG: MFS transporter [Dehalococcoidales bacterium]